MLLAIRGHSHLGESNSWTFWESDGTRRWVHSGRNSYFSKRPKAIAVRDFTNIAVVEFIRIHIIYWLDVPKTITTDNGQPFKSATLYKPYATYQIEGNHSSRYYAPANRLAEAFNKTVCTILEKMVNKNKKTWLEKLPELYGLTEPPLEPRHRPLHITWSLKDKVVFLLEIQLPSIRVTVY